MTHRLFLAGCAAVALAAGQTPAPATDAEKLSNDPKALSKPGRIEGTLLDERYQRPLKRGSVVLRPKGAGNPLSGETDDTGKFIIENVPPGDYTIEARRDGYLSANWGRRGGLRMPALFKVYPGEEIRDLTFRLEPWGAIEGKIRYADDGDPAMGVVVVAYRKQYSRGRLQYISYASAQSNDRGEYRIAGLAQGAYIIAAIYNKPVKPLPADGDVPGTELTYATTFFASGQKLTEAIPLRIDPGRSEVPGIDIFLGVVRTARVRVEATEACTGTPASKANVQVYRVDEGGNPVLPVNVDVSSRGNVYFIRGLGPGQYMIVATTDPPGDCYGPLRDRRTITVASHSVDDVKLTLVPPALTQLNIRTDAANANEFDISAYGLHLEPRSGLPGGNIRLELSKSRTNAFSAVLDTQEQYNVVVDRQPIDTYLKEPFVLAGASDIRIGTRGATIYGNVQNDRHEPITGASVTLIPDPSKDLSAHILEAFSNEQGIFGTRGVAPGKYIAIPWLDVAPCDFYNWENIDACRRAGTSVTVNEGESKALELVLNINR